LISPGTYAEAVSIPMPLTLRGTGVGQVALSAPTAGEDVITVTAVGGEVLIEGVSVSRGYRGISAGLLRDAQLTLRDVAATSCDAGLTCDGQGQLTLERCHFIKNAIGLILMNDLSEMHSCEILECDVGITLVGQHSATLYDTTVALGPLAISAYSSECGYNTQGASADVRLAGSGNRICGTASSFCPEDLAAAAGSNFLDVEWQTEIRRANELLVSGAEAFNAEDLTRASLAFTDALACLERAPCPLLRAYVEHNLAWTVDALGRSSTSLDLGARAREAFEGYGLIDRIASADFLLGTAHLHLGQYDEALELLVRAQAAFAGLGDLGTAARCTLNAGAACLELGWYTEALERLEAARDELVRLSDSADGAVAEANANIAMAKARLGDVDQALGLLGEAREQFLQGGLDVRAAMVAENAGALLVEIGAYEQALTLFAEARAAYMSRGMTAELAELEVNVAEAYRLRGDVDRALECLGMAMSLAQQASGAQDVAEAQPSLWWVAQTDLGLCYEAAGKLIEARGAYERAISTIEQIRGGLRDERQKVAWGEKTGEAYERLIDLLERLGEGKSAVDYAERCHARTLIDLLAAGPAGVLENASGAELRTGVVDAQTIEADLDEIIASLPTGTAALEYFVTEEAVLVWVITQTVVQEPLRLEIRREDLANQVIAFREALETEPSLGNTADEALLAQSRDLYALLVQPIEDKLAGMAHVVIIPSGPLHYLPFAALLDSQGTDDSLWTAQFAPGAYFGDRYALSYAPSLVTLKYAQGAAGEVSTERSLLALADPDSGDPALTRLPEARVEAEAVAALFSTHEVYVDTEATETVVQSQSSTASQLLLSTHGLFNAVNPMYSYLVLAPTDGSDGRLHTYEVFGLNLHADLVVLSACETLLPHLEDMKAQTRAVGGNEEEDVELSPELMEQLTSGDEIVGLTRAFLYAGTPSVLASLWSVYSEATKDLMVAFYGYLDQGMDKAVALRQAQQDVRRLYPHPVFWAAFNLVGDWR
jgi:CHAT domain-containing protein